MQDLKKQFVITKSVKTISQDSTHKKTLSPKDVTAFQNTTKMKEAKQMETKAFKIVKWILICFILICFITIVINWNEFYYGS